MKTPKEFDYDLWTTEDGKYMVRVKSTGEVTEVERNVMRVLRAEEKKMRRSYINADTEENEASILSLDAICDSGEVGEAGWAVDSYDMENEVQTNALEAELRNSLTALQLDLYISCVTGSMSLREYAKQNGVDFKTVWRRMELIQKKAKNFFE